MTILICTGTLFSNWQDVAKIAAPASPKSINLCKELSAQSELVCEQHFAGSSELGWSAFLPDDGHAASIRNLLSTVGDEVSFVWADRRCALSLNFWQSNINGSRFLLFYSSPEFELGNYISQYAFDETSIEKVIRAWLVRTQAMLTFFMNNRTQCLLVNVRSAVEEPSLLAQAVDEHFNLTMANIPATDEDTHTKSVLFEYLASSLLMGNDRVSELYDEVRSAATVICDKDKSMKGINGRSRSLIESFRDEAISHLRLRQANRTLQEEIYLKDIQVNQLMEELDSCFKSSREQMDVLTSYLGSDIYLKIAQQARHSR